MVSHDVGDSWDGDAQHAMGGPHAAVTLAKRRDDDLGNVKVVNAVSRRDDIDDGVNGTHLMEVDLFDGDAVRLRLRLGNDVEDAVGKLARARGERASIDDCLNLDGPAMLVMVPVRMVVAVVMVYMVMLMIMLVVMHMVVVVLVLMMVVVLVLVMVRMVMAMVVVMLMIMLVVVVVLVLVVVMPLLLRFVEVAVEPLHVMVVTVMLGIEHHVKVADVECRDVASRDLDLKAADAQAVQSLSQALLVRTSVKQRADDHVAADAIRAFEIQRPCHV